MKQRNIAIHHLAVWEWGTWGSIGNSEHCFLYFIIQIETFHVTNASGCFKYFVAHCNNVVYGDSYMWKHFLHLILSLSWMLQQLTRSYKTESSAKASIILKCKRSWSFKLFSSIHFIILFHSLLSTLVLFFSFLFSFQSEMLK